MVSGEALGVFHMRAYHSVKDLRAVLPLSHRHGDLLCGPRMLADSDRILEAVTQHAEITVLRRERVSAVSVFWPNRLFRSRRARRMSVSMDLDWGDVFDWDIGRYRLPQRETRRRAMLRQWVASLIRAEIMRRPHRAGAQSRGELRKRAEKPMHA